MKVCREFVFSGHVQGVGFRYTTRRIAALFEVTGYVKNLSSGDVELVAEGVADEVQAFADAVKHQMSGYISDCRETNRELQQFKAFEIRM